jgi:hypothetical protein
MLPDRAALEGESKHCHSVSVRRFAVVCRCLWRPKGKKRATSHGSFIPASKDCGHHARIPPPMDHSDHPDRIFIGRVRDQVVAHECEAKRPAGQVQATVHNVWGGSDTAERLEDLCREPVSGRHVVSGNEFPDVVEVFEGVVCSAKPLTLSGYAALRSWPSARCTPSRRQSTGRVRF